MLYVSDLDGTLLNRDALLNEDVPKRLNALIEQGLVLLLLQRGPMQL
mgnify:CR=1 FL=1